MASDDIAFAARSLVHGSVKICGLTCVEDVAATAKAGATHAGFIFAEDSARKIGGGAASNTAQARGSGLKTVGVFRDQRHDVVAAAAEHYGLDAIQLHGGDIDLPRLRANLPQGCEIWTACGVGDTAEPAREGADRTLFDTRLNGRSGGTGRSFDWRLITGRRDLPFAFLAGGIGPANARSAQQIGTFGIDIGSAVEFRARTEGRGQAGCGVQGASAAMPEGCGMRMTGRFGSFGGCFVPEILIPALEELEAAFLDAEEDVAFRAELDELLATYAGRPTPLTRCRNIGGRARIYLKREDLLHGGAHKTNQVLGQALLAKRMGKRRLIAETGAGQHGVATAMVGALFGMETRIYMGAEDVERQQLNVFRMELMGAEVVAVENGSRTLKDAINEALRDWSASFPDTHYLLGTAAGPHPFPLMVRQFQRVIGSEARAQILVTEGRLPDAIVACVGGGSNAIGIFSDFIDDPDVKLIGVEAAGRGLDSGAHGATILGGTPGILHGAETLVLQDQDGQIRDTWSVSAGLDYPGVGPEHSHLNDTGRADYVGVDDRETLDAFVRLAKGEGIIAAFESCHAVAHALKMAEQAEKEAVLVVNLSGRGDKDVMQAAALLGAKL